MKSGAFVVSVLKSLIYIISLVILIPLLNEGSMAVYISFGVYAGAKLTDYLDVFINKSGIFFDVLKIIGIICASIIIILGGYTLSTGEYKFVLSIIMLGFASLTCVVDVIETMYITVEFIKIKNQLLVKENA